TQLHALSLPDALPISHRGEGPMTIRSLLLAIALALAPGCVTTSGSGAHADRAGSGDDPAAQATGDAGSDPALARILRRAQEGDRSEEHTSELQSRENL